MDLRVMVRDESPRRVEALVTGLPPDQALIWQQDRKQVDSSPVETADGMPVQNGRTVSIAEFAAAHSEFGRA